jgi:hypothetical protein
MVESAASAYGWRYGEGRQTRRYRSNGAHKNEEEVSKTARDTNQFTPDRLIGLVLAHLSCAYVSGCARPLADLQDAA